MAHAVLLEQKKALKEERPTMPQAIEEITPQVKMFLNHSGSPANKYAICPTCGAAMAQVEKLPSRKASFARAATMITNRAKRVPSHIRLWKVADRAAVVIVLVTASWIAYSYRRPAGPLGALARPRSNAIEQHVPFVPTKLARAKKDMSRPQTASIPREEARKAAWSTPQQVRVGDNEIDYVSEDVTVRYFTPKPTPQRLRIRDGQIDYISEDGTERHFSPKPAPQRARVGDYQVDYVSEDVTVRYSTPKPGVVPKSPLRDLRLAGR
jgi:hypothetical protein